MITISYCQPHWNHCFVGIEANSGSGKTITKNNFLVLILLCLTPDDFTRKGEPLSGKGLTGPTRI